MIFNMVGGGSGGGYAFTLATGAALPGVVDNNCIFILTDTPVQDWHIGAGVPTSPSAGDIWLKTRSGNEYGIAIPDATPFRDVVLVVAQQYDGNAWVYRTGYIGVSGVWVEFTPPLPSSLISLEQASWADIGHVSMAGVAADYWSLGDTKTIPLGATVFGSSAITVEIIDMAHDPLADGSGVAGLTFCMVNCFTNPMRLGLASSEWADCELRATLRGAVYDAFPTELRAVIKTVRKQTGSMSTARDYIIYSDETLYLPSALEVVGESGFNVNYAHYNEGSQYARFQVEAARTKGVEYWWTRSPVLASTNNAVITSTGILASTGRAQSGTVYAACAFCV